MKRLAALALVLLAILAPAAVFTDESAPDAAYWKERFERQRDLRLKWKREALRLRYRIRFLPTYAIAYVFGPRTEAALAVVDCETGGTFSIWADNGQYENLFQMGLRERRTYGWHVAGSPAIVATRAAHRYFVDSGSDWRPWQCRPWGLAW